MEQLQAWNEAEYYARVSECLRCMLEVSFDVEMPDVRRVFERFVQTQTHQANLEASYAVELHDVVTFGLGIADRLIATNRIDEAMYFVEQAKAMTTHESWHAPSILEASMELEKKIEERMQKLLTNSGASN